MNIFTGNEGIILEGTNQAEFCQLHEIAKQLRGYKVDFTQEPSERFIEEKRERAKSFHTKEGLTHFPMEAIEKINIAVKTKL